jgi:hypothetical protein
MSKPLLTFKAAIFCFFIVRIHMLPEILLTGECFSTLSTHKNHGIFRWSCARFGMLREADSVFESLATLAAVGCDVIMRVHVCVKILSLHEHFTTSRHSAHVSWTFPFAVLQPGVFLKMLTLLVSSSTSNTQVFHRR